LTWPLLRESGAGMPERGYRVSRSGRRAVLRVLSLRRRPAAVLGSATGKAPLPLRQPVQRLDRAHAVDLEPPELIDDRMVRVEGQLGLPRGAGACGPLLPGRRAQVLDRALALELGQHLASALDQRFRQTSETRHVDPVGTV